MSHAAALLIFERYDAVGALEQIWLHQDGPRDLALLRGEERLPLPSGCLEVVFGRYAKPLGRALSPLSQPLELEANCRLYRARFRSRYDVLPKDYLVYEQPGEEPLCELATTICAALVHLAGAQTARR